jgi:hypothetical protein
VCASQDWSDKVRVMYLRTRLQGEALCWYYNAYLILDKDNWDEWKQYFELTFFPTNVFAAVKAIKYTFNDEELSLKSHILKKQMLLLLAYDYMSQSNQIHHIIRVLPKDLQNQFLIKDPHTVEDLVYISKLMELSTYYNTEGQQKSVQRVCLVSTSSLLKDAEFPIPKEDGRKEEQSEKDISSITVNTKEDIGRYFPGVINDGEYPKPIKFFEVEFKLRDETPIYRKPYPLSKEKLDWLAEELVNLKTAGIIRDSNSTFASPITIIPKADGSKRLCTDYRNANDRTDLITWPLPRIDDTINETGGACFFTVIDLLKGFWQVPITEETKKFTAFVTPLGSFEYNILPFGW